MSTAEPPPNIDCVANDLAVRSQRLEVGENDLPNALYRITLAYAANLLNLLSKEGSLTPDQGRRLEKLAKEVLSEENAGNKAKVDKLTDVGDEIWESMLRKSVKAPPSELALQVQRLKTAVKWTIRAQKARERGRKVPATRHTINIEVKTSSSECPMDSTETILFRDQPENYTTAVIIWNILKAKRSTFKGLGPCLHLYQACNTKNWFPSVHHSMKIKKLSKETPQGSPFLYIVDENDEYIVATVLEKNKRSDPGIRKKGIILRLDRLSLKASVEYAAQHANVAGHLKFQVRASRFRSASMTTLPLDTALTKPNSLIPFSSHYHVVVNPLEEQEPVTGPSEALEQEGWNRLILRFIRWIKNLGAFL